MWCLVSCETMMCKPWYTVRDNHRLLTCVTQAANPSQTHHFIQVLSMTGLSTVWDFSVIVVIIILACEQAFQWGRKRQEELRIQNFKRCRQAFLPLSSLWKRHMPESIHLPWLWQHKSWNNKKNVLVYDGIAFIKSNNERKSGEYVINIVHCNAN